MRVLVPATPDGLHPSVLPALMRSGNSTNVCVADVSAADETYFSLLASVWDLGVTFVVVEHDIEVGAESIASLEECPQLWCAYSYWVFGGDLARTYGGAWGLGCVKFEAELMRRHPDMFDVIGDWQPTPNYPPRHYSTVDALISQYLRGPGGLTVHQHHPNVTHHHAYDYAGAYMPLEQRRALQPGHPLHLGPTEELR